MYLLLYPCEDLVSGHVSDRCDTRYLNMVMAAICALCYIVAYLAPNLSITIVSFTFIGEELARVS